MGGLWPWAPAVASPAGPSAAWGARSTGTPESSTTQGVFELSGVQVLRASDAAEVPAVLEAAAAQAYNALTPTAVLLSQRLIGAKVFTK